jgi:hypothetical protein
MPRACRAAAMPLRVVDAAGLDIAHDSSRTGARGPGIGRLGRPCLGRRLRGDIAFTIPSEQALLGIDRQYNGMQPLSPGSGLMPLTKL